MRVWLAVPLVMLALGGCAKARPTTAVEPTVLQIPSPPPRVIVPPEPDPEAEALPELDKGEAPPSRRTTPRGDAKGVPPAKGETPPAATVEPARQPATVPPAAGVLLQPVLPTSAGEVERHVKEQLQRASRDLNQVNYGALSADAKAQYDMAKRFIEQANQALVDKNLVFAGKLGEKAGNIAAVLLGR